MHCVPAETLGVALHDLGVLLGAHKPQRDERLHLVPARARQRIILVQRTHNGATRGMAWSCAAAHHWRSTARESPPHCIRLQHVALRHTPSQHDALQRGPTASSLVGTLGDCRQHRQTQWPAGRQRYGERFEDAIQWTSRSESTPTSARNDAPSRTATDGRQLPQQTRVLPSTASECCEYSEGSGRRRPPVRRAGLACRRTVD